MGRMHVLAITGLLFLGAGAARADLIIEPRTPPQDKILAGTLAWEQRKQPDGTTVKGRLLLTTPKGRRIALPVTRNKKIKAAKAGKTIDAAKFVGKQIKLTARVRELPKGRGRKGTPNTTVLSVTRIEVNTPPAKAAPKKNRRTADSAKKRRTP